MHHEVDPAVLASLPPSMQLDLLVQVVEFIKYSVAQVPFSFFRCHLLAKYSADERAIDCREPTKVSESQEGW